MSADEPPSPADPDRPPIDSVARGLRSAEPVPPRVSFSAACVLLIALACWAIAGFWSSTQDRTPRHHGLAPLDAQQWIANGGPWPRAFFRLAVPVDVRPDSATLWIEADQSATVFVNQSRLNDASKSGQDRVADINPDRTSQEEGFDVLPALGRGANSIGVDLVDFENTFPAFRARLVLRVGGHQELFGTQPSDWRSTGDVSLTGQDLPGSGAFSDPGFAETRWHPAAAAKPRHSDRLLGVPSAAFEEPLMGNVLSGASAGQQLVAEATVVIPRGCVSGWIRIASPDAWQFRIDGRPFATGAAGSVSFGTPVPRLLQRQRPPAVITLALYDLCSTLGPGKHRLQMRADAMDVPRFYVDGITATRSTVTRFATADGWHPITGDTPGARTYRSVPSPATALGRPLQRRIGIAAHRSRRLHHLGLSIELVFVVAGLVGIAWVLDPPSGPSEAMVAVRAAAVGLLPATALVGLLAEFRHLTQTQPPFPSTPAMLTVVAVVAVAGELLALGASRLAGLPFSFSAGIRQRSGRAASLPGWLKERPYEAAVTSFALIWAAMASYRITFQPLWSDELASLGAAQGIRLHGFPQWPSGFQYWKSELFSALIAALGAMTHDSVAVLRGVSIGWFAATVVLFGLVLVPLILPRRPWLALGAVIIFATSPFEMAHARDLRMYQMAQFFVVLLAIVLLRAMVAPTTRRIAVVGVAIVAMYFTHEETFGVLVAIPVVLVAFLGLRWLKNWRWWAAGGGAGFLVALQVILVKLTHPLTFGVDQSNGPLIAWSPSPFYYLNNVFFSRQTHAGTLTLVTLLAVVGILGGMYRRQAVRLYVAAFWIIPVLVVALALPAKQTRYGFLSFPFEFGLAACGGCDLAGWIARAVNSTEPGQVRANRVLFGVTSVVVAVALMASMIGSVGSYGPAAAALSGVSYSRGQIDFDRAGRYVRAHLRPGDAVIAASPANAVAYSLGRAPDYWMPYHQGGRLLYLFEKGGRAVDTQFGIPAILDRNDLERAVDAHRRTWLITADGYLGSILVSQTQLLRSRFSLASEGEQATVFLASN